MSKGLALVLVLIFLTAPCLTFIQPAKATVENIGTTASITIQPANLVEGQQVKVIVQIYPPPPSVNDTFENLTAVITSPSQGISGYGPWDEGPTSSDTNGLATFTFYMHTFSGVWNVEILFPGQYLANNTIYYQRGYWQKNFVIHPSQTPTPLPTSITSLSPTPTPSVPEFSWLMILPLVPFTLLLGCLVRRKRSTAANVEKRLNGELLPKPLPKQLSCPRGGYSQKIMEHLILPNCYAIRNLQRRFSRLKQAQPQLTQTKPLLQS